MSRTDFGRSARLRLSTLGPGLLAIVLTVAGCSDETTGAGSADLAASRKAAATRGGGTLNLGPKRGDVAPTRARGKGTTGGPVVKIQGKAR